MAMAMALEMELELAMEEQQQDEEVVEEEVALDKMPQECLSLILGRTSAYDASRLASVCRSFAIAARSNITWLHLLPPANAHAKPEYPANPKFNDPSACPNCDSKSKTKTNSTTIANSEANPIPTFSDCNDEKRQLFRYLSQGIYLNDGREHIVLLKRLRDGIVRIISASAMDIAWGNDARFWRWVPSRSSCFPKVAHLKAVCWFAVNGKWEGTFTPGEYSVCWRLKVVNPQGGQQHFLAWKKPLRFSLSYLGTSVQKELDLRNLPRNGFEKWFEFMVGEIVVRGIYDSAVKLKLEFGIEEIDCSFWKGGLFLDCLTVRPSHCDETIYRSQPELHASSARGRPGVF